jgi:hypothetical protein
MKNYINKKILYIYLLAILGLILTLYYIWFRFIRERIPRDIPFNLTPLTFFCLCYICLIYMFILYRLYKPKITSNMVLILRQYLNIILKPFYFSDKLLKKNMNINRYLFDFYLKCIKLLELYKTGNNNTIFIIFNIMPRIIILGAFMVDVFYFNKLHLFYYALVLSLLPLFYLYSIYSISQYLNLISNKLDKYFEVKILSTIEDEYLYRQIHKVPRYMVSLSDLEYNDDGVLDSKYFIKWQSANLIFDYDLYEYICVETDETREYYSKKYNIKLPPLWIFEPESDEISKLLAKEFNILMPQAYYFQAFVETHTDLVKINFIKFEKYFIIGYLICWLYILGVSIHTLNIKELIEMLNSTWEQIKNPFTE